MLIIWFGLGRGISGRQPLTHPRGILNILFYLLGCPMLSPKLTCHSGVRRSLAAICQHFWWPAMTKDIRHFVGACEVCTQNKSSNQPPVGLLHPLQFLPVPGHILPWIFFPSIQWQYCDPHRGVSLFQGSSLHSCSQTPLG